MNEIINIRLFENNKNIRNFFIHMLVKRIYVVFM
jgi:hypothetical protein